MKQNSSEADSSVSDNSSVSKFISRWNVDGFLTKLPHERDWLLYFGNVYCFPRVVFPLKISRQIMEQNSSSDLYLGKLSV